MSDTLNNAVRMARHYAVGGTPDTAPPVDPTEPDTSIGGLANAFHTAITAHRALPDAERIQNGKAARARIAELTGSKSMSLLGKNAKLTKTEEGYEGGKPVTMPDGRPIEAAGLTLSPAYKQGKFTTCPNSASCSKSCLGKTSGAFFTYGGGGKDMPPEEFKGTRLPGLAKTRAMLKDPQAFAVRLHDQIDAAKRGAVSRGAHLGVRLNVLSDLHPRILKPIIDAHPDVTFYDYTKLNSNPVGPNHHLTHSSTGVSAPAGLNGNPEEVVNPHSNWRSMRKRLEGGDNVAMAFTHKSELPESVHDEETGKKYQVVTGDTHDFRPLDQQPKGSPGVIVGLKNKAKNLAQLKAAKDTKGFMVHYDPKLGKEVKIATQPARRPIDVERASGGSVNSRGLAPEYYEQQFPNHEIYREYGEHEQAPEWHELPSAAPRARGGATRAYIDNAVKIARRNT